MMIAVLTPITSPAEETSGPPELPGLSAASVCTTSSIMRPVETQRAPERRDDAGGHGGVETERIADGDGDLAALQLARVAEPGGGQMHRLLDAHQREVGVGIVAEHAGGELAAFERRQRDRAGAVDDVAVGEREAVGRDDDPGAGAACRAFTRTTLGRPCPPRR